MEDGDDIFIIPNWNLPIKEKKGGVSIDPVNNYVFGCPGCGFIYNIDENSLETLWLKTSCFTRSTEETSRSIETIFPKDFFDKETILYSKLNWVEEIGYYICDRCYFFNNLKNAKSKTQE